ncbi:hypothetical protein BCF55_0583 [Hydrogenivirga caldilitoris]|uniref:Uncharacterized protein n=1 Tax=Hydrogenivirga caldilitoris TaxID=246264 RepID=A0A497XN21_9AQUI|nr:hypothetical protein [Hydrogenivirga caldilitoris]RLJ70315.1 hypothetical protein BCF55_0583 [Hydrogenivirga caldilitoris]
MEIYCDAERIFISRDYRVEGISKKEFIETHKENVVWQSAKLSETPRKLTNTRYHLVGAGGAKLVRMDRSNGETVEIDAGNEVKDIASDLRDVFFVTAEGIYRVPAERFAEPEIVRLPVSDILDKPVKSVDVLGNFLFVIAGNFLYKLSTEGEKLSEKALADGLKVLSDYDGPVAITEKEVIYFTEDMEVLSNGSYEGVFIKAEHGAYNTFLLSDKTFSVFGKTGKRYAHVEAAHYSSFTEGLNHIYFYDEEEKSLSLAGKKDLLGDNFQEIDLATLVGIVMGSLMLAEREGAEVLVREEKGFIDTHINGELVPVEKIILRLSKYFPEVFYLYKNPGYYEQIDSFAERFDLFKVEGRDIRLNTDLLERLIEMHSSFKTFKEDIAKGIIDLAVK